MLPNPGYLRAFTLCGVLIAVGGCANGAEREPCVAEQSAALYFGSAEPEDLELSAVERAVIGTVEPNPAIALCTGVMIARGFVLTAAHCDIGRDLSFRPSADSARPAQVVATTLHPLLDVMLLELDPGSAAAELEPIPLWTSRIDDSWIGSQVTLAGVGETEDGEYGQLRFVNEAVVAVNENEIGVDGMGRSGACAGDSGGPLLVAAQDGSPQVAGVLDRGSRDCVGLDIYVRADRLREWADATIGPICSQ